MSIVPFRLEPNASTSKSSLRNKYAFLRARVADLQRQLLAAGKEAARKDTSSETVQEAFKRWDDVNTRLEKAERDLWFFNRQFSKMINE